MLMVCYLRAAMALEVSPGTCEERERERYIYIDIDIDMDIDIDIDIDVGTPTSFSPQWKLRCNLESYLPGLFPAALRALCPR